MDLPLRYCVCRLGLATMLLVLVPAAIGQAPHPAFEVASIRPAPPNTDPMTGYWSFPGKGRFNATHLSLAMLIQLAYNVQDSQIANKPSWLETNLYDVDAKPEEGINLTNEELRPRLQELLQERFHLVAHMETRSAHGYALVAPEGGQHLIPTKGRHFAGWRDNVSPGYMHGANWSMPQLAQYLTTAAGFPVVDRTGLAGSYDIRFDYNPNPERDSQLPTLDVALKQATGLLLKPEKVPVETLVIDSVDKTPTEN